MDGGSNPLSSTATVHIQVEDVNDNPPEFQNESYTLFVAENETSGITLIKVRQQISVGKKWGGKWKLETEKVCENVFASSSYFHHFVMLSSLLKPQ